MENKMAAYLPWSYPKAAHSDDRVVARSHRGRVRSAFAIAMEVRFRRGPDRKNPMLTRGSFSPIGEASDDCLSPRRLQRANLFSLHSCRRVCPRPGSRAEAQGNQSPECLRGTKLRAPYLPE
jgi:hypothetical protein